MVITETMGQVTVNHDGSITVRDENGETVTGGTQGPTGYIAKVESCNIVPVQSSASGAQCWLQYRGIWYRLC